MIKLETIERKLDYITAPATEVVTIKDKEPLKAHRFLSQAQIRGKIEAIHNKKIEAKEREN